MPQIESSPGSRTLGWALFVVAAATTLGAGLTLAGSLWRAQPPNATWSEALLFDGLLLGLFALQHSGMARGVVQRALLERVPLHVERTLYAALSGIMFLALAWLWRRPPGVVWDLHGALGAVMYGAAAVSAVLLGASLVQTSALALLGVTALRSARVESEDDEPVLNTGGLYAFVRHPMLLFSLLLFWIWPHMSAGRALFAGGFTLYVVWAAPLEERNLRALFGAPYAEYAARVPRWIPRFRSHR